MPIAFVLINTEIDAMEKVLDSLKNVAEITEAYSLYGTYDIIAKVKSESTEKLNTVISGKIRKLNNVRNTITLIAVEKM